MRRRSLVLCCVLVLATLVGGCTKASPPSRAAPDDQHDRRTLRPILAGLVAAWLMSFSACTASLPISPTPTPSSTSRTVDYAEIDAGIEDKISSGSATLDSVQGVLVSVDGQTVIAHYRNGFDAAKTEHMWSVTKSVVATLIGIAISDGLIESLDQTLAQLLPQYRKVMAPGVSAITLRQLMSMTGGVDEKDPSAATVQDLYAKKGDLVKYILRSRLIADPGTQFHYSNASSHLVIAVLVSALRRAGRDASVLDYAREKLFDPLDIKTRPAYVKPPRFDDISTDPLFRAGFGWAVDPRGIQIGAFGLRLSLPDMLKIGQLYLNHGNWADRQIVPVEWVDAVSAPSEQNSEYGLLWWIGIHAGYRSMEARGSYGQLIMVVPERQVVVAVASSTISTYSQDDPGRVFALADQIATLVLQ
jgi:CubicO group peptidase (beta-lactamase class C family)